MNKVEIEQIEKTITRVKQCLLGKIAGDINSRLPEKPTELDNWGKYKLIKNGEAKLKVNLRVKDLMNEYGASQIKLVDAFTYPKNEEQIAYDNAYNAVKSERAMRELAVETAFDRVGSELIMGLIDAKTFLDKIEIMQSQSW